MVKFTRMFPLLPLIVGVVLPVLPAEGGTADNLIGSATGIARPGKTGVTITGRWTPSPRTASNVAFNPCRDSVEVSEVILDVPPGSDVNVTDLPITLMLDGFDLNTCLYVNDPVLSPAPPIVTLKLSDVNDGQNTFNFRLAVREGTYGTPPNSNCPGGTVNLSTSFTLETLPGPLSDIEVSFPADWRCFGRDTTNFLRLR